MLQFKQKIRAAIIEENFFDLFPSLGPLCLFSVNLTAFSLKRPPKGGENFEGKQRETCKYVLNNGCEQQGMKLPKYNLFFDFRLHQSAYLYLMLFTCLSLYYGSTHSKKIFR